MGEAITKEELKELRAAQKELAELRERNAVLEERMGEIERAADGRQIIKLEGSHAGELMYQRLDPKDERPGRPDTVPSGPEAEKKNPAQELTSALQAILHGGRG